MYSGNRYFHNLPELLKFSTIEVCHTVNISIVTSGDHDRRVNDRVGVIRVIRTVAVLIWSGDLGLKRLCVLSKPCCICIAFSVKRTMEESLHTHCLASGPRVRFGLAIQALCLVLQCIIIYNMNLTLSFVTQDRDKFFII